MNDVETTQYTKQDIQNMLNKNNGLDANKLRKTSLTPQIAYNIFYEIAEIPRCQGCQKDLRFGSFKTGYGTCGDRSCPLEKEKTKARKQIGLSQKQYSNVTCEKCGKISKTKNHNQKICPSCVKIIKKENILQNIIPSSIEKLKEVITKFLDEDRRSDSWNEILQKTYPDVFVLAFNYKEINNFKTLNQSIYHLYYDLIGSPTCKGCGGNVRFVKFHVGYTTFCPKTACQWVDKKDKQKRLDSIAKTVNNRRIDNNIGEYSYVNFNYKNMKYANRKFGTNKYFIPEFETLEEFDNNVEFLDFLDPLDFSNRYYCCVNNITQLKSCPTCSNPVHNVRLRYCSVQCASTSEVVRNKTEQTNIIKYGTKAPTQNSEVLERRTNNFIEKYGVPHHMNLESVVNNIKENNNGKYGSDWYLGSKQRQLDCLDTYGVYFHSQLEEVKQKGFNTKLQKYGPDFIYLSFKTKDYVSPSGKLIKYQGYENFLLDYLFKIYKEEDIITSVNPVPYQENGVNRNYFPDAATKDNIIYEVKGEYTFKQGIENGSIYLKSKAAVEKCDKFILIVYSNDGEIIQKFEFTKNNLEELEKLRNVS